MSEIERLGSILGITTIFAAITFAAVGLIAAALVHLLANAFGSLLISLLVTGLMATLISIIIYFNTIRPRLKAASHQFMEFYEIISYTTNAYRRAKDIVSSIFR